LRPLREVLRSALFKAEQPAEKALGVVTSREEAARAARDADDKERLIGLIAAPVAAAIAFLVNAAVVAHDPPALLANGQPNKAHVAFSLYNELLVVMLALSVLMLILAWMRKRMYLGIALSLDGLTLFNLHYWGFSLPFLIVGAWLLVRSYRVQRVLREAHSRPSGARTPRAPSSKRYTPPNSALGSRTARTGHGR
jgi:hypothetical protein